MEHSMDHYAIILPISNDFRHSCLICIFKLNIVIPDRVGIVRYICFSQDKKDFTKKFFYGIISFCQPIMSVAISRDRAVGSSSGS